MKIVVIGGGVIGLSSAYYLQKAGHEVTVIDSSTCGKGASEGNAGWIVPSLSHPFNSPGAIPDAMKSLLKKDSRIRFGMIPNIGFLKWVLMFSRNSSPENSAKAREAIVELNKQTMELFHPMLADIKAEHRTDGLLMPYLGEEAMQNFLKSHEMIIDAGYVGRAVELSATQLRTMEPDLNPDVIGGIHLMDELSVRPESVNRGLATRLSERGAQIVENQKVRRLYQQGKIWKVETDGGTQYSADKVVVAAGVDSARILKTINYNLSLEGGRGVSITTHHGPTLNHAIKIDEVSVACTPFEDGTRFSGTFDFVGHSRIAVEQRMTSVIDLASRFFPQLGDVKTHLPHVWSGIRPCTPDSVPYIGPVPNQNDIFVATGHGTLGMTLGPVTGQAIAHMIDGEPTPDPIRACALDRPEVQLF